MRDHAVAGELARDRGERGTGIFTSYLNDYPKMGVWSDGWYMTANMFDQIGTGFGVRVWALNRSQMITGGALQEVHFDTCTDATCDALLPANYHGTTAPPAGATHAASR